MVSQSGVNTIEVKATEPQHIVHKEIQTDAKKWLTSEDNSNTDTREEVVILYTAGCCVKLRAPYMFIRVLTVYMRLCLHVCYCTAKCSKRLCLQLRCAFFIV